MSLSTLPVELISAIFRGYCPTSSLWALCLCNRRLHTIAEAFLYEHFNQHSTTEIPYFLRTVARKPHLLKHVRSISVSFCDLNSAPDHPPSFRMSNLSIEDRQCLRRYIPDDFSPEYCDFWAQQVFEDMLWEAAVAFLLVLSSSSLECVSMHRYASPTHFMAAFNCVLSHVAKLPRPFFPNLHRVFIEYPPVALFLSRQRYFLYDWLLLPGVNQLEVTLFRDYRTTFTKRPKNSHTTHLSLKLSLLEGNPMADFLSNLCALQYFAYQQVGHSYFAFQQAAKGLVNSRRTLKSLTLSLTHQAYPLKLGMLPATPDFSLLCALQTLDVEIEMLVGWRAGERQRQYDNQQLDNFIKTLPENLENLVIRGCGIAVGDCMYELFVKRRALSNLKMVKVSVIVAIQLDSRFLLTFSLN